MELLSDDQLAHIVAFCAPRDLEALTVASKTVWLHVLPRFPIWKRLFCYRWVMLNFPLPGATTDEVDVVIDGNLRALFPATCTESRMFQLLAHAIIPVPSYADISQTRSSRHFRGMDDIITSLTPRIERGPHRSVDFTFGGRLLGGDRCVRANVPFPTTFHVAVFKRKPNGTTRLKPQFHVGVVGSGYFEISISKRGSTHTTMRLQGGDMTSIGLATSRFVLVGKQPGWDRYSYGYHGDDGHFFHHSSRGQEFGPAFDVDDTVGCGVRRYTEDGELRSSIFFTNNGDLIPTGDAGIRCPLEALYPVVGVDSTNAIHVNFGQEPFYDDDIADEFLQECQDKRDVLENQLQWYDISESDAEESEDEDMEDDESEVSDSDDHVGLHPYHIYFGDLPEGVFGFEQFSDDEEWAMSEDEEMDEEWSDGEEEEVADDDMEIVTTEEGEGATTANAEN